MADILPFKGTLYDASPELPPSSVLAPPYDVIDSSLQEHLYDLSPYNIVRLILGRTGKDDSPSDNRYTRAADLFERWKETGILRHADVPAIYLYEQEFEVAGTRRTRRGFISLLRLEDFSAKGVHPHEVTYAEPREDRMALLKACRAYFSQIFALYGDESRAVEAVLWEAADEGTLVDFVDAEGIRQTLRSVSDPQALAEAARLMADKQLFIADGHHRYETALLYMREMRAGNGPEGDAPYDFVPTFFVSAQNPGLVILPVHRVLPGKCDAASSPAESLGEQFILEKLADGLPPEALSDLTRWMDAALPGEHRFGMITAGGLFSMQLRAETDLNRLIDEGHSDAWRRLDVSIIQELAIRRCLSQEQMVREGSIKYMTDASRAMAEVAEGRAWLAFLLQPTTVAEIEAIALQGEKMPPKSSYFHPKPLSGIVTYDHTTGFAE